jgi:hypothetical protein
MEKVKYKMDERTEGAVAPTTHLHCCKELKTRGLQFWAVRKGMKTKKVEVG